MSAVAENQVDLSRIQRDLEAENIEWSNRKIHRVTQAIREMWQKYHLASVEVRETFREDLISKCIATKQAEFVIDALLSAMASMVAAETVRVLKLQ